MLADALWSETYRLIRNRTVVFLSVFFVPLLFAVGGIAFHVMNKTRGDALAAQAALPGALPGGLLAQLGQVLGTCYNPSGACTIRFSNGSGTEISYANGAKISVSATDQSTVESSGF